MTVAELIAKLQTMDHNLPVFAKMSEEQGVGCELYPASEVNIDTDYQSGIIGVIIE